MICGEIIIDERILVLFFLLLMFFYVPFFMLYSRFIQKKYGVFVTKYSGRNAISINKDEFIGQSSINKFFYTGSMIFSVLAGVFFILILIRELSCYVVR